MMRDCTFAFFKQGFPHGSLIFATLFFCRGRDLFLNFVQK